MWCITASYVDLQLWRLAFYISRPMGPPQLPNTLRPVKPLSSTARRDPSRRADPPSSAARRDPSGRLTVPPSHSTGRAAASHCLTAGALTIHT